MSRSSIRIIFAVVLSLIVIAVVYTSVLGLGAARVGSHLVSGARVNFDHYRVAVVDQSSAGAFDNFTSYQDHVHGCEGQQASSPDD